MPWTEITRLHYRRDGDNGYRFESDSEGGKRWGPRGVPNIQLYQSVIESHGGRGGIRTHERVAPLPVFKTGALNHSATRPHWNVNQLAKRQICIATRLLPLCYHFSTTRAWIDRAPFP
jgi:hypothetical protein